MEERPTGFLVFEEPVQKLIQSIDVLDKIFDKIDDDTRSACRQACEKAIDVYSTDQKEAKNIIFAVCQDSELLGELLDSVMFIRSCVNYIISEDL